MSSWFWGDILGQTSMIPIYSTTVLYDTDCGVTMNPPAPLFFARQIHLRVCKAIIFLINRQGEQLIFVFAVVHAIP